MISPNIPLAIIFISILFSCSREDTVHPVITLNKDDSDIHYRTEPYFDPGVDVADNYTCSLSDDLIIHNEVDINNYGTYQVVYTVADEAGNLTEMIREVDIILPITDYYSQTYSATDSCTSSNYFYTGLIQDCDCDQFSVIVGNISNFGASATFTLPLSGQYNQLITLDTVKNGVDFSGLGIMSSDADTLFWDYTISDSLSTDVCRSVWVKEN